MLKVDTYSLKGTKLDKTLEIPDVKENLALLAQAIRVYEDRAHIGHAKTKTRADINRTTKKVYKQKGTGGARHGSRRAPIYVGGGVAHGRKLEEKKLTLSQKMRKQALDVALFLKVKSKDLIAVEGISGLKKTKDGQGLVTKLGFSGKKLVVLADKNIASMQALKNLAQTKIVTATKMSAYDIVMHKKVIMDADIWGGSETAKTKKQTAEKTAKTNKVVKKTKAGEKKTK